MGLFDFLKGKPGGSAAKGGHDDGRCACEPLQEAGVELLVQGNFAGALAQFKNAMRVCPTNHKAWGNSGICLRELGRHDEAMASLDKAISIKPDYGIAWENKGVLLVKLRREDEALSCFKTSWTCEPGRAPPHVRAARIYIDRKQYDDAIARCNAALAAEPGSGIALAKLSLALHEKGDRESAREAYERAVKANPTDVELLNNFGTLFEDLGKPAEAIELYRRAVGLNPGYRSARLNLERVQKGRTAAVPSTSSAPKAAAKPPPPKVQKDSVEVLIATAVQKGFIPPDRDIGMVAEIMPMFDRASRMFHGIVVDAMGRAAAEGDPTAGLAVMQRSCMYLFGKGVQAVMVWGTTTDGKFGLDFEPSEMIQMELGPSLELSPEENQTAADAMQFGIPLFGAHQAFMQAEMPTLPRVDEAFVRGEMLKTLQWVPRIAISYGLMRGYHKGEARGDPEERGHDV